MLRWFFVFGALTLLVAGCSLRELDAPPDPSTVEDVLPDGACCTTADCAMMGQICNTATCACEATTCCTDQQCTAAGGLVCNTDTCMCEESTCCSEAGCAAQGRVCNTDSCMCEDAACCTTLICSVQGDRLCNTDTCMCEDPVCCTAEECGGGQFCNTESCICEACCNDFECTTQGKVCNMNTCMCEEPCCTDAQCAQTGEECNETTCMCEEPACCTDSVCLAQAKVCNTTNCMCEDPVCCDDTLCGAQNQVCNTLACVCVDPNPGQCTLAGNPCDLMDTQPVNFVCIDNGNGGGECRDFCVLDDNNPGEPCALGTYCNVQPGQPGPERFGYCDVSQCPGFFAGGCPSGEKCIPNGNATNVCTTYGAGQSGASCNALGDCGDGFLCVGGSCRTPDCGALSDMPACAMGDECGGLVLGPEPLDLGFCFTPCTAFASSSNCGAMEWCSPIGRDSMSGLLDGECIPDTGTDGVGDACTAGSCAGELICISGICEQLCDPDATPTGQGGCGTGNGCSPLQSIDSQGNPVDLEIGTCLESCDYHGSTACQDGNLDCFPGEIFGEDFDRCFSVPSSGWPLGERDNCTSAGYGEFDVCSYTGICLVVPSVSNNVLCYDLCMTSEGGFGSTPHGDCRNAGRQCDNYFPGATEFGLCD